jgi:hypothetical protein
MCVEHSRDAPERAGPCTEKIRKALVAKNKVRAASPGGGWRAKKNCGSYWLMDPIASRSVNR